MHTVETQFGGRRLAFETGRLAQQADGAVVVTYGDAVILGTVVMSDRLREGIDYFPLSVDYEERSYSIGKIPGSVFRREGRPPLAGILASRLTDRPLRPLFPKGMRNEVQIILTVLSHDRTAETDVIGTIAASAALMISGIPFEGPVSAVRVGLRDGEFTLNPTIEDNVVIYSGATILGGNTVIGRDSIIGGNVWIISSVPPGSKVMVRVPKLRITAAV